MSYDHSLNITATVKPGTTHAELDEAFSEILKYFDVKHFAEMNQSYRHESSFDESSGELFLYTAGDVGDFYIEKVKAVLKKLGMLTVKPGFARLTDHDSGDTENAVTKIVFGSSDEAVENHEKTLAVEAAMESIQSFLHENQYDEVKKMLCIAVGVE